MQVVDGAKSTMLDYNLMRKSPRVFGGEGKERVMLKLKFWLVAIGAEQASREEGAEGHTPVGHAFPSYRAGRAKEEACCNAGSTK